MSRKRSAAILGIPMDLGGSLRGVDMGPSAIRIAGLEGMLKAEGVKTIDKGNLFVPRTDSIGDPKIKFATPIKKICLKLSNTVQNLIRAEQIPIVLGGDHSIAIGTANGLAASGGDYGLWWIDAHGDCNDQETSPSGNIHGMALAMSLGVDPLLDGPPVDPSKTVLYGIRDLDTGEKHIVKMLKERGMRVITMSEIDRRGVYDTAQEALDVVSKSGSGFHLSFDMDVIDPRYAPGVGTPVSGGLSTREAHLLMQVAAQGDMVCCELVEVNPIIDIGNKTGELAADLVLSAFGKRTL